jgi:hypothetical protein
MPDWIWFVEIDGEAAAFIVLLPNLNDAISDLDGKLLPFGWAKLIWRLKFQPMQARPRAADGREEEIRPRPHGACFAPFLLIDAIRGTAVKASRLRNIRGSSRTTGRCGTFSKGWRPHLQDLPHLRKQIAPVSGTDAANVGGNTDTPTTI